jgi:hypothetical protein
MGQEKKNHHLCLNEGFKVFEYHDNYCKIYFKVQSFKIG